MSMSIKSILFTLLSLGVIGSNAAIYMTAPVASTTCTGSKPCPITWKDDGTAPTASTFGLSSIGLYVGGQTTQALVQDFGTMDPSQVENVSPVINPGASANGNNYFIRIQSQSAVDATGAPLLAFSSKFTMTGMTGQLTEAQANAINGVAPGATVVTTTVAPVVANTTTISNTAAKTTTSSASKSMTTLSSGSKTQTTSLTSTTSVSNSSSANSSSNTKTSSGASGSIAKVGLGAMIGVAGIVALIA